jgi:hypothetical protein
VEELPNNGPGEANKASDKTGNQDIKHFILMSGFAVMVILVVVVIGIWVWSPFGDDGVGIMFIQPLKIEQLADSDCVQEELNVYVSDSETNMAINERDDENDEWKDEPDRHLQRCYTIENYVEDSSKYESISVVRLMGLVTLVVAFLVPLVSYGSNATRPILRELSNIFNGRSVGERVIIVIRNAVVGGAVTLFLFTIFTALEQMMGLVAIDNTPMNIQPSIAILTTAVFVTIITFFLHEWISGLTLRDIGGAGIVFLLVSFLLSFPFASHNWSGVAGAYSTLGHSNSSTAVAGFGGSQGLFLYTMISLGLVFWAFTIDTYRLFVKYNEFLLTDKRLYLIVGLGFFAGLGSMFVGIFPSADEPFLHKVGSLGGPAVSLLLILVLAMMYPNTAAKCKSNSLEYPNRKNGILLAAVIVIVLIVVLIVGETISLLQENTITILEVEFAYFLFFLLFIQLYALYLTEYIDESTCQQQEDNSLTKHILLIPGVETLWNKATFRGSKQSESKKR